MFTRHHPANVARTVMAAWLLTTGVVSHAADKAGATSSPLMIQEQGSFAVGGTVVRSPGTYDPDQPGLAGQTLHGDHARVFYQVPVNARKLPLVLWHGFGQFGKTWESTPDGREGFQTLLLRQRFPVHVVDQPPWWRRTQHGGG